MVSEDNTLGRRCELRSSNQLPLLGGNEQTTNSTPKKGNILLPPYPRFTFNSRPSHHFGKTAATQIGWKQDGVFLALAAMCQLHSTHFHQMTSYNKLVCRFIIFEVTCVVPDIDDSQKLCLIFFQKRQEPFSAGEYGGSSKLRVWRKVQIESMSFFNSSETILSLVTRTQSSFTDRSRIRSQKLYRKFKGVKRRH
jgi:hypothetical protein